MATAPDTKDDRISRLTRELRSVNAQIRHLLERLPLKDHTEVFGLNKLLARQEQLVRMPTGGGRVVETTLLDNERHSARFLQTRYRDAVKNGKLRSSKQPSSDT